MRFFLYVTILAIAANLVACKKDSGPQQEPMPDVPTQKVLLKEITQVGLPSPAYHFVYDESKRPKQVSYSAGLAIYDILYQNDQISELRNTVQGNKDRIEYVYNGTNVELVRVRNEAGQVYRFGSLSYDNKGRLSKIEWEVRIDGVGFALEQTLHFAYDSKNNLLERHDQRHPIQGQQTGAIYIDRFEQYDDKMNVESFSLLHPFDRHLVLLPGVTLQQNNPKKIIRSGDGVHYEINYSYTYNRNVPAAKLGDMIFTTGPDAGKHFTLQTQYNYY